MLKKKIKDHAVVTSHIPLTNGQGKIKVQTFEILDRRIMKKRDKAVIVGLIKWSNFFDEDSTWEELGKLQ